MVKQRLRLCFAFVCNSTENTGFFEILQVLWCIPVEIQPNSSKSYKMTFFMQMAMCKKVTNLECLKVSKLITLE